MHDYTAFLLAAAKADDQGQLAKLAAQYLTDVHDPLGLGALEFQPPRYTKVNGMPGHTANFVARPDNIISVTVQYDRKRDLYFQIYGRQEKHEELHECVLNWTAGRSPSYSKTHVRSPKEMRDFELHVRLAIQLKHWVSMVP